MTDRVPPPLTASPVPGASRNVLPAFPCLEGLGEPTFTFFTRDNAFAVQYYFDWRAPSEQTAMDRYLRSLNRRYAPRATNITVLHCRDPQLGTGQLYLFLILAHVDGHAVVDSVLRSHPRYEFLHSSRLERDRHLAAAIEEESKPLNQRDQITIQHSSDMAQVYTDQIGNIEIEFRNDEMAEERSRRGIIRNKKNDIEYMIGGAMQDRDLEFTDSEEDLIDDCKERGDSNKVRRMLNRKIRAQAAAPYRQ